jgi:hypothetical protein
MISLVRHALQRYFYFGMAMLLLGIVLAGFSPGLGANLLHPDKPRPAILYVHSAVFSTWMLLLLIQTGLARVARPLWHRRLGWGGALLGVSMPFLGAATALAMQRWRGTAEPAGAVFLAVSFNDMLSFGIVFGCALYWRKRLDYHRRLMLIATTCLTVAAIARLPGGWVPAGWWYGAVDVLLALGMLRDLLVDGRVHVVYRYTVPALVAGQALAMYLYLAAPSEWAAWTYRLVS